MRPPFKIRESAVAAWGPSVCRGNKLGLSLEGGTPAEIKSLEVVLLALNALDLSEPKARRAIMAVVRTWPGWMALRPDEQVEAMSK